MAEAGPMVGSDLLTFWFQNFSNFLDGIGLGLKNCIEKVWDSVRKNIVSKKYCI